MSDQSVTVDVSAPTPDPIDNLTTKRERSPGERGLKQLLEKERAGRQRAEQQRDHASNEAAAARYQAQNSALDNTLNAIGTAQAEADDGQLEFQRAMDSGDYQAAARAQSKIAEAKGRQVLLEQQKSLIDQRAQQARQQPQRQMTVEDMPDLLMVEQDWLRQHPDLVLNHNKIRRLTTYFDRRLNAGSNAAAQNFSGTWKTASAAAVRGQSANSRI
jgi:hypothetical protein